MSYRNETGFKKKDEIDVGSALGFLAFALLWYSTSCSSKSSSPQGARGAAPTESFFGFSGVPLPKTLKSNLSDGSMRHLLLRRLLGPHRDIDMGRRHRFIEYGTSYGMPRAECRCTHHHQRETSL
jgi:hypothetical protein